jgi:hypothetical protein
MFGKVPFTRPVGRPVANPRGAADLPVDRALGLVGGFSLGVVLTMARLCAQMAFAGSREMFAQSHGWAPSRRATLRIVDGAGEQARPFLEQAPAPDDDGDVLFVQADGRGAPMIDSLEHRRRCRPRLKFPGATMRSVRRFRRRLRQKPRRTKGKKSKNSKLAVIGVLYTLRRTPQGVEGPIGKRLIATFDSHEELFIWLRREADKRGYGRKRTVFLGDGSPHLWRLQQQYLPAAEPCIDWYHVIEKIWEAGECLHDEGSDELRAWVAEQAKRLRRGAVAAVVAELETELADTPRTGPGNKGRRERLAAVLRYLQEHRQRMPYRELRRADLDIGTGAAEGGVRNLIAMRLDGPGMRWSRGRSERLLHLRCILLNGQWAAFASFMASRQLKLPAQPVATVTHDAKAAA